MGLVLCRSQPSASEVDRSSHNVRLKQRDKQTEDFFFLNQLFVFVCLCYSV